MSDPLDLKRSVRTINDFPIKGIKFRDITSLIETPEAFKKTCNQLTKLSKEFNADIIASIESRGFIFAGTICLLYTSPSPRDGLLSRMPSSA